MAGHTSTGGDLASEPSAPVLSNPSMGDEPAAALVHEVQVFTHNECHRAECSCGWASDWHTDDVAAVVAGVEHPEIAVGPPDGLDGFMGELLDLQDDVSDLVVWLAENWSAALPVPELWGTSARHRRPLDVTVRCASHAELDQVAAVLEAPVQSDRFYDSDGCTYRCARRRFGRVVFEAWRYER
jgi:hypothetical protein